MITNVRQLLRQLDGGRVVLALASPAPAALVTLWGVLVISMWAHPARPYTDGAWMTGDLISLLVIGGIVGLLSRPAAAAVGIPLGLAAAVALQLYDLAAVVSYQPVVGSPLTGPEWTPAVAGALLAGFAAIAVGYMLGRGAVVANRIRRGGRGLATRRVGDRTGHAGLPAVALAAALAATAVAVLLVGASLLPAAKSAYVSAGDLPTIRVVIQGNEIATAEPASIPAGWARIAPTGGTAQNTDLWLTKGPLPDYVLATHQQDRIWLGYLDVALFLSSRPVDLRWPGYYELVLTPFHASRTDTGYRLIDGSWSPPPGGSGGDVPVSDARLLTVTAGPATGRSTEAGGNGGRYLTLPFIAALGIEGWAAAGVVLLRLSWFRRPTGRRVLVAIMVGAVSACVLGLLILLAINLSHNPF